MKIGSLFSGAGLGDFGFEMAGYDLRWQVEIDDYAQKVLNLRWPDVKKYKDIKTINTDELERVDLITGGFPCQPFSVAGKQDGADDDRNLWPEMFRIIKGLKPRWVVCENVPGIIPIYLDTVLADLETQDYTYWPIVFSSHSLGAWHKRDRLWIVANTRRSRMEEQKQKQSDLFRRSNKTTSTQTCADTKSFYAQEFENGQRQRQPWRDSWWVSEPAVGRVASRSAHRVDRLKCLGNGQTPCSTYVIGKWIMKVESSDDPSHR